MEFELPCAVYVQTDERGYITDINSSAFIGGEGWLKIDEGYGDCYHHAQGNYFSLPLMTDGGAWRYRLEGGAAQECSGQDIAAQEAEIAAQPRPQSDKERIAELEAMVNALLGGE